MKLPVVSGKEFMKRLKKKGYVKELDRGLLRALIRDAGITVDEFIGLKKAK